jgi:predicted DNA-binding transcriptional regulator AlpA
MLRKMVRKPAVLAALGGISNSTFYAGIAAGKYPKGTKIDPDGRSVAWWEDELEAIQKAAIERQGAAFGAVRT